MEQHAVGRHAGQCQQLAVLQRMDRVAAPCHDKQAPCHQPHAAPASRPLPVRAPCHQPQLAMYAPVTLKNAAIGGVHSYQVFRS